MKRTLLSLAAAFAAGALCLTSTLSADLTTGAATYAVT